MYFFQTLTDTGDFADPYPDDYQTADTLEELGRAFRAWKSQVRRLSDAQVSVAVYKGEPEGEMPCDCPPDFWLMSGPRDGMRRING